MDRAPSFVQGHADEFFAAARRLVGDRLAECRVDEDRGLRVTVVDLTTADVDAIDAMAADLAMAEWTRVELAAPADLRAWAMLREDLARLSNVRPLPLTMWPSSRGHYQRPPVSIDLEAFPAAVAAAADLHRRYGDFVSLRVGAFAYPMDPAVEPLVPWSGPPRQPVDPDELDITLDGPLTVSTGDTVTHGIRLGNRGDRPVVVVTDGDVRAHVIAPFTGAVVGGYCGAHQVPMITFTAKPGQTVRIPLLVGTASSAPALGYAVPPGAWQLTAALDLDDGRHLVSAPLDFVITR